jgi:hypothetical protein
MASIEGLSLEHCQALVGVQVGDLILVQSYPKRIESEQSEADSDGDSEGSQGDGDNTSTSSDEEAAHDQPSSHEQDGEGSDSDEKSASEDDENDHTTATTLYLIHDLSKDENGKIKTIILREVSHCLKPSEATTTNFHIYGEEIIFGATSAGSSTTIEGVESYNIQDVIDNDDRTDNRIQVKPNGDNIRQILFHGRCPAQCNDGWISTQEEMHALVDEPIRLLLMPYAPTCPVCIGKPKMQEHQTLRELLEDSYQVDIGTLVDFYGSLSIRRKALGYSFKQFDEREWGMVFDDMLSEDEDEDGPNGEYWEDYQEAQDPNANPAYYPASDAAIAAIPQKMFRDVANGDENAACAVCITKFTDDTVVAELSCGHYFDLECAQKWLKTSNACPKCRKKLPTVEVSPAELGDEIEQERLATIELVDEVDNKSTGSSEDDDDEFKDALDTKFDEIEMDGEDVVMSDAEDGAVGV